MDEVLADPPYTGPVPDTALIVGSAPCLHADLAEAMDQRPKALVFALNEAGGAIAHIDHLIAGHYYKAGHFVAHRARLQPDGNRDYRVHACWEPGRAPVLEVHHWWHHAKGQATSAWVGVRIALAMGSREVILCGCPMDTSGYFNDGATPTHDCGVPRVGYDDRHPVTRRYRERFAAYARSEGAGVASMSGWTREILGAPLWTH